MKFEELPLINIFNNLRQRHGLPLGVDDYLVVLRSLQSGFGIGSREELAQLCCLVWAKSEAESRLVRRLFEQMWRYSPLDLEHRENISVDATSSTSVKSKITENETITTDELFPNLPIQPSITPEPVQAVQAVRSSRRHREFKPPRYSFLAEYFPVTRRQMKQNWRYLRRLVREGLPIELDVEATVVKMGQDGILLEPVLVPRRCNQTDLVLLIDREGSMVPFHDLSKQLVDTAQRGGNLRQTHVFYFHDYVDEYLYRHPALMNAEAMSEVLGNMGEETVVLIVSDGGAARRSFDSERVESTKIWLDKLRESVRYLAWLNPMPNQSWENTTAGEIANFVPMFEMSRQGMNGAIRVLRGGDDDSRVKI